MILLSIYLILAGLGLVGLIFPGSALILGVLAILAGVMILAGR
jgi:hypothetical protein